MASKIRTATGSRNSGSGETCKNAAYQSVQLSKERDHPLPIPKHELWWERKGCMTLSLPRPCLLLFLNGIISLISSTRPSDMLERPCINYSCGFQTHVGRYRTKALRNLRIARSTPTWPPKRYTQALPMLAVFNTLLAVHTRKVLE
jgi:hypothetical protein